MTRDWARSQTSVLVRARSANWLRAHESVNPPLDIPVISIVLLPFRFPYHINLCFVYFSADPYAVLYHVPWYSLSPLCSDQYLINSHLCNSWMSFCFQGQQIIVSMRFHIQNMVPLTFINNVSKTSKNNLSPFATRIEFRWITVPFTIAIVPYGAPLPKSNYCAAVQHRYTWKIPWFAVHKQCDSQLMI